MKAGFLFGTCTLRSSWILRLDITSIIETVVRFASDRDDRRTISGAWREYSRIPGKRDRKDGLSLQYNLGDGESNPAATAASRNAKWTMEGVEPDARWPYTQVPQNPTPSRAPKPASNLPPVRRSKPFSFLENPAVVADLFSQNRNVQAQGLAKINNFL